VADPVGKELPNDGYVCEMRLAVDGMGRGGRAEAGYIDVHSYGESGAAAARTLTKGWLVAVDGRIQHESWEQDGQKRSKHLVVGHVEFLARPRAHGDADEEASLAHAGAAADGDDIPF
jgi:single-strand DNA-binding protein